MITNVGVLRSGGDTKFCLYLELCGIWLIGVPLAFTGAFIWELPVYWVYGLVFLEEVLRLVIGFKRIHSKKWINNLVESIE